MPDADVEAHPVAVGGSEVEGRDVVGIEEGGKVVPGPSQMRRQVVEVSPVTGGGGSAAARQVRLDGLVLDKC